MEQTLFQEVNGGGDSVSTHSAPGCPEAVVFFATVTESTGLTFYFAHPELPLKCGLEPNRAAVRECFSSHLHARDRMELEKSIARPRSQKEADVGGRLVHPKVVSDGLSGFRSKKHQMEPVGTTFCGCYGVG